jgi:hypothetical protein
MPDGEERVMITGKQLGDARKAWAERRERINNLILSVLKSHLLIEQFMNGMLEAGGKNSEDMTFAQKMCECENLKAEEIEDWVFPLLKKANQLRNKIAHTLDQDQIKSRMDEVRATFLATLKPNDAEAYDKFSDDLIAASAFEQCGAFIVGATEGIKSRKAQG